MARKKICTARYIIYFAVICGKNFIFYFMFKILIQCCLLRIMTFMFYRNSGRIKTYTKKLRVLASVTLFKIHLILEAMNLFRISMILEYFGSFSYKIASLYI